MDVIGLVVALPREIPRGFTAIVGASSPDNFPFPFFRRITPAGRLIMVQAGIGSGRAAAGARALMQQYRPQLLMSFGFAGGLVPELARGTLVVADRLVSEDPEARAYEVDQGLVDQLLSAARFERLPVQRGVVVTATHAVTSEASKVALAQTSGASAVDMETWGIAQVACQAGIPWVAVRAIVDAVADPLPLACMTALDSNGRVMLGRLSREIWRSPRVIGDLFWLAQCTALARRRLSRLLRHLPPFPSLSMSTGASTNVESVESTCLSHLLPP